MIIYDIGVIFIIILYTFLISAFLIGWNKIKLYRKSQVGPSDVFISVIVPFHNEQTNIPLLINSINNQSLNKERFELILINDHSTDQSVNVTENAISGIPNFRIFDLQEGEGKKNALIFGISHANGNLIVSTDADCTHHKEWLETIYSYYIENRHGLIIGPVLMKGSNHFESIQCLDFFSLMASGAGACGIRRPIMCNGANLAYEKEILSEIKDPMYLKYISGDDIFLMHKLKQIHPEKIHFLKSPKALVTTEAEKNFKVFFKQRKRWVSKSRGYYDKDTLITAFIVLIMNASMLISLLISLFKAAFFYVFLLQLTTKAIIDFIFLCETAVFYKKVNLLWYFITTEIFNIFIVPIVAITGLISKQKWK